MNVGFTTTHYLQKLDLLLTQIIFRRPTDIWPLESHRLDFWIPNYYSVKLGVEVATWEMEKKLFIMKPETSTYLSELFWVWFRTNGDWGWLNSVENFSLW